MKRFRSFSLALLLNSLFFLFVYKSCQSEDSITLSTYYPSPRGVYSELRLSPKDISGFVCSEDTEGVIVYDKDEQIPKMCVCQGASCSVRSLFEAGSVLKSDGEPFSCSDQHEGDIYYDTGEHALQVCSYSLIDGYAWADAGSSSPSYKPGDTFQVSGENPVCPEGSHADQYFWKARKCCKAYCGGGGSTLCCTTVSKWFPTAPTCVFYCCWKRYPCLEKICVANEWSMVTCTAD